MVFLGFYLAKRFNTIDHKLSKYGLTALNYYGLQIVPMSELKLSP